MLTVYLWNIIKIKSVRFLKLVLSHFSEAYAFPKMRDRLEFRNVIVGETFVKLIVQNFRKIMQTGIKM